MLCSFLEDIEFKLLNITLAIIITLDITVCSGSTFIALVKAIKLLVP